jgi:hypothetical protein
LRKVSTEEAASRLNVSQYAARRTHRLRNFGEFAEVERGTGGRTVPGERTDLEHSLNSEKVSVEKASELLKATHQFGNLGKFAEVANEVYQLMPKRSAGQPSKVFSPISENNNSTPSGEVTSVSNFAFAIALPPENQRQKPISLAVLDLPIFALAR